MNNSALTDSPSRRQVLVAAAATVTLPILGQALGAVNSARGNAAPNSAATEQGGWFTTTFKPADLKDNEFTALPGRPIVLARSGKTVAALTNKCTHSGCAMNPAAGSKTLSCQCHRSQFNLDGSVAQPPAKQALSHFAIRVNDKGLIEIDAGQKLGQADKAATLTI
jgi:cytochrome b6-f complex iron-sulfur subunit